LQSIGQRTTEAAKSVAAARIACAWQIPARFLSPTAENKSVNPT
jgi:hypothetical protein